MHQKSESKSRNRVSARAKLEVSNVFYAYFILKQKNVKYGVFYYFSAVSFNYGIGPHQHKNKLGTGEQTGEMFFLLQEERSLSQLEIVKMVYPHKTWTDEKCAQSFTISTALMN